VCVCVWRRLSLQHRVPLL